MRPFEAPRVGLREVAKEAGVSKSTAGLALQNLPGVKPQTLERVRLAAKKLGYSPDARLASWMTTIKNADKKSLLPLAWINSSLGQNAWRRYAFHRPWLEGAEERAAELGYRIEEVWTLQPGMTARKISRSLYNRGIEGVLVPLPLKHLPLDWKRFAGVTVGGALLAPKLHSVLTDSFHNYLLALKMLRRYGYRRIGTFVPDVMSRMVQDAIRIKAVSEKVDLPNSRWVPPLLYPVEKSWKLGKERLIPWFLEHRPDVIICNTNWILEILDEHGIRVPKDVGVAHLSTDDDVKEWAGICSNRRVAGRMAVDILAGLIRNRQFGPLDHLIRTLVPGNWHGGTTLLTPKPADLER